jgi:hypothetical protein
LGALEVYIAIRAARKKNEYNLPPLRSFGTGSKESGDSGGGRRTEQDGEESSDAEAEEHAAQRKAQAIEEANRSLLAASEWIVHPIFSKLKTKRCSDHYL